MDNLDLEKAASVVAGLLNQYKVLKDANEAIVCLKTLAQSSKELEAANQKKRLENEELVAFAKKTKDGIEQAKETAKKIVSEANADASKIRAAAKEDAVSKNKKINAETDALEVEFLAKQSKISDMNSRIAAGELQLQKIEKAKAAHKKSLDAVRAQIED